MPEAPKSDERFIETVVIGDNETVRHEGTIAELNSLAPPVDIAVTKSPLLGAAKAEDVIKVMQFTWDIIKDSNAKAVTDGACTRILWADDENWVNYENAEDFASPQVEYKLNNFAGVNCYTVKFRVVGTYRARHPKIGGQWIPVMYAAFSRCDANWPWEISGKASIDGTHVSNMKTREDPIPQVILTIKISTKAKFAFNWESHERTFLFNINGKDGVKQV